jgi:hypothetical protein
MTTKTKGKARLIPMSRATGMKVSRREKAEVRREMDSVKYSLDRQERRGFDVLMMGYRYYTNLQQFQKDRDRNKRYTYGDQWGDLVEVGCCGKTMTEGDNIRQQGGIPMTQNLIRRLVRNVLGVYRGQDKEPTCTARDRDEQKLGETMSTLLQYNRQVNRMTEVDGRTFEDFLIGGLVMHKKWAGWWNGRYDCWTSVVPANNIILDNNMRDYRGWDVSCIGEIHDISFNDVIHEFAKSPEDYARLREIYQQARKPQMIVDNWQQFGVYNLKNVDFFFTPNMTMCRVIELWRKETKPRYRCHDYNNGDYYKIEIEDYQTEVEDENQRRMQQGMAAGMEADEIPLIEAEWFIDTYWYYYYLTPFGHILGEGETPYEHGSHPYVFKAYPFIDGEIHSFVADVIDQQRYTNNLITLYNFIMRTSAKNTLIIDKSSIPDDMTLEDIADSYAQVGSVIALKLKDGQHVPQQISANCVNIGIADILNLQLKFFEDISGVNGALQGKPGYAGTSGTLYAQQTQNATTSLLDMLESFSSFVVEAAYKDVKNIQQFYDDERIINIAGKNNVVVRDPNKIRDVEFDLSIVESTSSPAYRQLANDFLMEIWRSGQINLKHMLEVGDFPFADQLLQQMAGDEELAAQGQQPMVPPTQQSPELQQQIQNWQQQNGAADVERLQRLQGMLAA